MKKSKSAPNIPLLQPRVTLLLLVIKELKATNETLKSLQTQLELAYATTASSGTAVTGSGGSIGGMGSGTILGGSVAVPGGVPGSTTLTAILETKDARIQTLEKEVLLLECELQRIKECGGRLREQLLRATAVPSGTSGGPTTSSAGILFGGPSTAFTRGPSLVTSLVPYGHSSTSLTNAAALQSSSYLSGTTTGVANPYHDRYNDPQHQQAVQQLHQHHHLHHYHQQQQQQQQHYHQQQQAQLRHLKQIEPAAAGALALHAHTFNKHDMNFKRQVSFFINNVRIEKNDTL